MRKVFVYRLVACDSPEEEEHTPSFRKELISKMWFEWNQNGSNRNDLELEQVDLENNEDPFFECLSLRENVKALYKKVINAANKLCYIVSTRWMFRSFLRVC